MVRYDPSCLSTEDSHEESTPQPPHVARDFIKGILIIALLLFPAQGGIMEWGNGTPSTYLDPASDSILGVCHRAEGLQLSQTEEWTQDWTPSTSIQCAPKLPGALVLTLDDQSHLPSWWDNRMLFIENGIRLTLFIDRAWHLNDTEWEWLKTFKEDGHEIAVHTKDHASVTEHLDSGQTMDQYIDEQILPELELFHNQGLYPTAFAYPNGHRTPESDVALLEIFEIVRGTNRWYGNKNMPDLSGMYDSQAIKGHSTDREYDPVHDLENMLESAAQDGRAVVTYGHRLTAEENPYHTTEPDDLIRLALTAQRLGMTMMTISELSTPANSEGTASMYRSVRVSNLTIADRMLENCWNLPRFQEVCFDGDFPTWREDPYDENYWRFVFYSLRPLMHLLHAWETTGEDRYRERMISLLESFNEGCLESPYVYRHQADKHGAAFRAMVLTEIRWSLAHRTSLSEPDRELLDGMVLSTADYLMLPSNFESTYNHGFNQAAALLSISTNFPHLQGSYEWDQTARERLAHMMEFTVDEDGVMMESTPYYHHYVLLLMGDVAIWSDKNSIPLPKIFHERFPKMLDYITDMARPDGSLPLIGSGIPSGGLSSGGYTHWESIHPRLEYIRSGGTSGNPGVDDVMAPYIAHYPISGHTSMRSSWSADTSNISHVMIDAGPYRTSHSQLDHFTLTWYKDGPVIVDPGLFSYEDGPMADYFRGSSAHNVVVVDGQDQPKTYPIMGAEILQSGPSIGIQSTIKIHGCDWMRAIAIVEETSLIIMDDLRCRRSHELIQTWHLDPRFTLNEGEVGVIFDSDSLQSGLVEWETNSDVSHSIINGQMNPIQGWTIDAYESAIPAPVIEISTESEHLQIITVFQIEDHHQWTSDITEEEMTIEIEGNVISIHIEDGLWRWDD